VPSPAPAEHGPSVGVDGHGGCVGEAVRVCRGWGGAGAGAELSQCLSLLIFFSALAWDTAHHSLSLRTPPHPAPPHHPHHPPPPCLLPQMGSLPWQGWSPGRG
jgi:hypothetical protein